MTEDKCVVCGCLLTYDEDILERDFSATRPTPHCVDVCMVCAQKIIFEYIGRPMPMISWLVNGR